MKFETTRFAGARLIVPDRARDARGYFMRTYCAREFEAEGLETGFVQHSTSFSARRGTVRGMHWQAAPHGEVKVVRCLKGAIVDVIVDIDPNSRTYRAWQAFELSADNEYQLYIPKGFAHGFQTLTDDVLVGYLISEFYAPDAARGARHDDTAFGIEWPLAVTEMSDKDRGWPDF
ncbi:MAG TPA: dTDP-4-dehydrorhamnose 3,5-epimerase [Hyphomicrobiaceae bacterium]|nr:dTDP-4-dehydrorhamnose 3,5-epimerase [Hyphomicrobiaceae bacterium]